MASVRASLHNALQAYQQGSLEEAKTLCRQVLAAAPQQADGLYLLGMISLQESSPDAAEAHLRQALALQPENPAFHNALGGLLLDRQQLDEALACFEKAMSLDPSQDEFFLNMGIVLHLKGNPTAAAEMYRLALTLNPAGWDIYNNLGNAYRDLDNWDEARAAYQQSVALNPQGYEAHYNLAAIFQAQRDLPQALFHCREAIRLNPGFAEAHDTLGSILCHQDHIAEAVAAYEEALRLNPGSAKTYYNLGIFYTGVRNPEKAMPFFQEAMRLQPDYWEPRVAMAEILSSDNQFEAAMDYYQQAWEISGKDALRVKMALTIPTVFESTEAMVACRARSVQLLEQLAGESLNITRPVIEVDQTSFYFTYHGVDNLAVQKALAQTYRGVPTYDAPPREKNAKPRIGFISRFLRTHHTIGKLVRGVIEELDRHRFEVVQLAVEDRENHQAPLPLLPEDCRIEVPRDDVAEACRRIAEARLDVLVFCDIGMEATTYFIAYSRLAPVQCVFWGHPETTGIPTMDYFLTSRHLEGENPQERYTERVALMDRLSVFYHRPELPNPLKNREELGLPEEATLYACPQALYKLHPEFDPILAGILRRDPQGRLVLLFKEKVGLRETLLKRWKTTMPDVLDRVIFINSLPYEDFLNLQAVVDVILDPLHFGGGNTHYEALATGTPVVTFPQAFLRSRITLAQYQQMGILDCIADSPEAYVELAVRLGRDPVYRQELKARILSRLDCLYSDHGAVRELEAFFLKALEEASPGA